MSFDVRYWTFNRPLLLHISTFICIIPRQQLIYLKFLLLNTKQTYRDVQDYTYIHSDTQIIRETSFVLFPKIKYKTYPDFRHSEPRRRCIGCVTDLPCLDRALLSGQRHDVASLVRFADREQPIVNLRVSSVLRVLSSAIRRSSGASTLRCYLPFVLVSYMRTVGAAGGRLSPLLNKRKDCPWSGRVSLDKGM